MKWAILADFTPEKTVRHGGMEGYEEGVAFVECNTYFEGKATPSGGMQHPT